MFMVSRRLASLSLVVPSRAVTTTPAGRHVGTTSVENAIACHLGITISRFETAVIPFRAG